MTNYTAAELTDLEDAIFEALQAGFTMTYITYWIRQRVLTDRVMRELLKSKRHAAAAKQQPDDEYDK